MVRTLSTPLLGKATYPKPCELCGKGHGTDDHWRFLETLPPDPADFVDDCARMRLFKPDTFALAERLDQYELRKALFLKQAGRGDPQREKLCEDLMHLAGGLDAAFAAAFGPRAAELFGDARRLKPTTRRHFMRSIAAGAALLALASSPKREESAAQAQTGPLEKINLRVGFIPITCATPIIMAEPMGFYQRYGLDVELIKLPNWAAVRDSAIAGELDAYHMLAPMPIAITLGLGSVTFPMRLASIENINGQAITIAKKYLGQVNGPEDLRGFTIGVPFPYSMHNLLIRYYLASGGLNPDTDVTIQAVPPPDSVARLTVGDIDAMLMPDPFNQRAVFEEVGFIHMLTRDLWQGHPCCAFVASEDWINENPNTFNAVNKAIIDGAGYASNPALRIVVAPYLAPREFLNQPAEIIEAVLTGNFEDGKGNTLSVPDRIDFDPYPWQSFSRWITSQFVRWNFLPEEQADYGAIGNEIFLTDLARDIALELGQNAPPERMRVESLRFDEFDPNNPAAYVRRQIQQFGL